jgi:quinohemoprotein ethanol dehydrogenase
MLKRTIFRKSAYAFAAVSVFTLSLFFAPISSRQTLAQVSNVDWPFYGNDLGNQRYQNVDQINPANVSNLKPTWIFHTGVLDDERVSFEVSPLVINGIMYITTGHDDVFALNAATGDEIWAYHPLAEMPPLDQLRICCGRDNRGVAYGNGKVFIGRLDSVLVALDANTGKVVWKKTVEDWRNNFTITMAPQFVNGKVITGISGGEFEVRGRVFAFDAETGALAWTFFTTPESLPSAPSWAGESWEHGGGTVWTTPAVDPGLGLIYVTTGNAAPDLNGIQRNGDNLFTSSIVAVDINTGVARWYFQEVHHDIWDYDGPQPAVLFSLNGVPAISHCQKSGEVFVLDRRNGKPIHPVTETPVPSGPGWQHASPTQPISSVQPLTPREVEIAPPGTTPAPRFTPPQPTPLLMGGPEQGCEWPPAAYSPRTKYIYYGARYEPAIFQTFPNNTEGFASSVVLPVPGLQTRGIFGATDSITGQIVWKQDVPDQPARSGMVVAGDLVFYGQNDGMFKATNAGTGANLWSFSGTSVPNGGGANAAPIAYVVGGKEFVANAFGGSRSERGRQRVSPLGDALIAFSLPDAEYTGPHVVQGSH